LSLDSLEWKRGGKREEEISKNDQDEYKNRKHRQGR